MPIKFASFTNYVTQLGWLGGQQKCYCCKVWYSMSFIKWQPKWTKKLKIRYVICERPPRSAGLVASKQAFIKHSWGPLLSQNSKEFSRNHQKDSIKIHSVTKYWTTHGSVSKFVLILGTDKNLLKDEIFAMGCFRLFSDITSIATTLSAFLIFFLVLLEWL